jgi:hypothetical protein
MIVMSGRQKRNSGLWKNSGGIDYRYHHAGNSPPEKGMPALFCGTGYALRSF